MLPQETQGHLLAVVGARISSSVVFVLHMDNMRIVEVGDELETSWRRTETASTGGDARTTAVGYSELLLVQLETHGYGINGETLERAFHANSQPRQDLRLPEIRTVRAQEQGRR